MMHLDAIARRVYARQRANGATRWDAALIALNPSPNGPVMWADKVARRAMDLIRGDRRDMVSTCDSDTALGSLVTVLVGPPGSGKSTWAKAHRSRGTWLSLDAARAFYGTGEHDQTATADAVAYLASELRWRCWANIGAVVDCTNTVADRGRGQWLRIADEHDREAQAVVFRTPLAVCLWRNWRRDRTVPVLVVIRMWWRVRRVTRSRLMAEGFRQVQVARRCRPPRPASTKHG